MILALLVVNLSISLAHLIFTVMMKYSERIEIDYDVGGDGLPHISNRQMPRPEKRGSIYIPPTEVETAREQIIEKNREQGLDTPIEELREQ